MTYLNIPKDFFIKACRRIQFEPSENTNAVVFDLDSKYVLVDGEKSENTHSFHTFMCSDFNIENKDIIDYCYECFRQWKVGHPIADEKYNFDGEYITINSILT